MKRKLLRSIIVHTTIWTFAILFWVIMRDFGQEVERPVEIDFWQYVRINTVIGIIAGILFGTLSYFFEKKVVKHVAFWKFTLIATIANLLVIMLIISFGMRAVSVASGLDVNWLTVDEVMDRKQIYLLIGYAFLVNIATEIFKQINKNFGPGNLWKMIKGEFYSPKEDERVFMFLDLRSSTHIAETLGHLSYSKLIQSCFKDLDVVQDFKAEVYQYVGDEVVLTWRVKSGLNNANCLKAFFAFQKRISERSDYYKNEFGLVPEFKAGVNVGKVVVAEVGDIKREIAYHGDTMNTAARIQGQCNTVGKDLLISHALLERLTLDGRYSSQHEGDIPLKGKSEKVNIYSVEEAEK